MSKSKSKAEPIKVTAKGTVGLGTPTPTAKLYIQPIEKEGSIDEILPEDKMPDDSVNFNDPLPPLPQNKDHNILKYL